MGYKNISVMSSEPQSTEVDRDLGRIIQLLWAANVKDDIFSRWTQGFNFSVDEPTALVQLEGGPCAILVSVQAHILKHIITEKEESGTWKDADSDEQNRLLVGAVCEILKKACGGVHYHLVHVNKSEISTDSFNEFHSHLRVTSFFNIMEVKSFLIQNIKMLKETFGILLFLYSVIYSRGLRLIEYEMNGCEEPLIDPNHGYGSQVLINLMITGNAVDNVFNNNCEIGGLSLFGIQKQSDIGFLTLLEYLRYCEVGSYLKKPNFPVWVLGSETHLTAVFSFEKKLSNCETPADIARTVFSTFDPEGNNFIKTDLLGDLLRKLNLLPDITQVEMITNKLDPEGLGIVLLSSFMDEFYPDDHKIQTPDMFTIYHYNGQPYSNLTGRVVYRSAMAILLECDIKCVKEDDPLFTCLQTKWPNIDLRWDNESSPPSMN